MVIQKNKTKKITVCWLCSLAVAISSFCSLFNTFFIFVKLVGIDPTHIRAPPIRNRTILLFQSLWKRNSASSFWNYEVPVLYQIGFGYGWSSTWAIEAGWIWNKTVEVILNNQHISKSIKMLNHLLKKNYM